MSKNHVNGIRLGYARWQLPGDEAAFARAWFWIAFQKVLPHAVEELAEAGLAWLKPKDVTSWEPSKTLTPMPRRGPQYEKVIREWAGRYHLTCDGKVAPWVLEHAKSALMLWAFAHRDRTEPLAELAQFEEHPRRERQELSRDHWPVSLPSPDSWDNFPREAMTIQFPECHWDPFFRDREEARAQIKEAVLSALDKELDRIEAKIRTAGAEQVPVKRNPRHFSWAVRVQCGQETVRDIWEEVSTGHPTAINRRSFDDAVYRVLELVGLDHRKHRGGRPKKEPTTKPRS